MTYGTLLDNAAQAAGVEWFGYQLDCFSEANKMSKSLNDPRMCLYYKTGAGKSITALACMALWGHEEVLVIAPPSTHGSWVELGEKLGIKVDAISHAKFRMKTTKLERDKAVIADEFHLFGGHTGQGWVKLDRLAAGLQAPLILASATPNYNDAERVYCIQHVMDPRSVRGGYIEFLYQHCQTQQNNFSMTPDVVGFLRFKDAAEYLASLPGVMYLPDDSVYQIEDLPIWEKIPAEMDEFGYNRRKDRIIASIIEEKHARVDLSLIHDDGLIRADVLTVVHDKLDDAVESVLIFCNHSTVAESLSETFKGQRIGHGLVTGKTSAKQKQFFIDQFREGMIDVLIGTASLATGTDGLDKVCDTLIIVDDTDDDSLRRQLVGRILPRGKSTNSASKRIFRLVLQQ